MTLPQPFDSQLSIREIISGSFQDGEGNCASIAAIKASLYAFGTKPVFRSVDIANNMYVVVMRDSEIQYQFTRNELIEASDKIKLSGQHQQLHDHMCFMFAAMAKRAQAEHNDRISGDSYSQAIDSLNDGEYWKEGPHWLGLQAFVHHGPNLKIPNWYVHRYLKRHDAAIAKSPKHTWFSSRGHNDAYGRDRKARWSTSGAISLNIKKISVL